MQEFRICEWRRVLNFMKWELYTRGLITICHFLTVIFFILALVDVISYSACLLFATTGIIGDIIIFLIDWLETQQLAVKWMPIYLYRGSREWDCGHLWDSKSSAEAEIYCRLTGRVGVKIINQIVLVKVPKL